MIPGNNPNNQPVSGSNTSSPNAQVAARSCVTGSRRRLLIGAVIFLLVSTAAGAILAAKILVPFKHMAVHKGSEDAHKAKIVILEQYHSLQIIPQTAPTRQAATASRPSVVATAAEAGRVPALPVNGTQPAASDPVRATATEPTHFPAPPAPSVVASAPQAPPVAAPVASAAAVVASPAAVPAAPAVTLSAAKLAAATATRPPAVHRHVARAAMPYRAVQPTRMTAASQAAARYGQYRRWQSSNAATKAAHSSVVVARAFSPRNAGRRIAQPVHSSATAGIASRRRNALAHSRLAHVTVQPQYRLAGLPNATVKPPQPLTQTAALLAAAHAGRTVAPQHRVQLAAAQARPEAEVKPKAAPAGAAVSATVNQVKRRAAHTASQLTHADAHASAAAHRHSVRMRPVHPILADRGEDYRPRHRHDSERMPPDAEDEMADDGPPPGYYAPPPRYYAPPRYYSPPGYPGYMYRPPPVYDPGW